MVFQLESGVGMVISLAVILATLWAFVDAVARRGEVYVAAGKLTKQAWLLLLGLALAVQVFMGTLSLLGFVGIVVMLVYLVDVRPALVALTRRR